MANSIVAYVLPGSVSRSGENPAFVSIPFLGFPDETAVDAAMATLVTDGAIPTQAHVTTTNTALAAYVTSVTTFVDDITTMLSAFVDYQNAATIAQTGDVIIAYDPTLTQNQIKIAIAALLQQIEGIA